MTSNQIITAAVLVIGDEILSGRTKDSNSGYIADYLTGIGIDLKEVRVVPDEMDVIVEAVRSLSKTFTYVFTTGGIGPTHDDITADAIANAFNVGIGHSDEAIADMKAHYPAGTELNEARLRMARIPFGASLIKNRASAAPGFKIENVHVMAGVPTVMHAMMDEIGPTLQTGKIIHSRTVESALGEGTIAAGLGAIQDEHPDVSIGSYPTMRNGKYVTNIVLRGREEGELSVAETKVSDLVVSLTKGA